MDESLNEKEIDLRAILAVLRRNILSIILVTLIFAIGAFVVSKFFMEKQYRASATLIVNNKSSNSTTVNQTEIVAAQDLAEVYAIIIKSDTVLQQVIDNLNLSMSYETLKDLISVSSVNSTQVIEVSMTYKDAQFAEKVVANIVEVAPPIIADKVEAGSVKVISDAKISNNGSPVSPSVSKNTMLGAIAGLAVILLILIIKEMFNNTFKSEAALADVLKLPVIGIIPEVDKKEFEK